MTAPKCEQCGKFVSVKSSNVFSKPFEIPDGMSILENGVYWFHKDCKLKSNDKRTNNVSVRLR